MYFVAGAHLVTPTVILLHTMSSGHTQKCSIHQSTRPCKGNAKANTQAREHGPTCISSGMLRPAQQPCQLDLPMALLKMRAAVFSGQHRLAEAPDRPCSSGCPDRLATAATDGTVRLWDLASQHQLGVALPRPDQWSILAFDPGGINLVAFYGDGPAWCGTWTLKAGSSEPAQSQAVR